jgi:hypothetical protein
VHLEASFWQACNLLFDSIAGTSPAIDTDVGNAIHTDGLIFNHAATTKTATTAGVDTRQADRLAACLAPWSLSLSLFIPVCLRVCCVTRTSLSMLSHLVSSYLIVIVLVLVLVPVLSLLCY